GGVPVKLVEREPSLGGMLRNVHTQKMDGVGATVFLNNKINAIKNNPLIDVMMESQVTSVSGSVGHYSVTVKSSGDRKDETKKFDIGAIILASGAQSWQPKGLYQYDGKRVVTQLEFEQELKRQAAGSESGSFPADVIMILCAGQRNKDFPYCSGICCEGALEQAIWVKAINPQAKVTVLFRDFKMDESIFEKQSLKAKRAGVTFVRYTESALPRVDEETVEVYNEFTGKKQRLPYDRIVLASPLTPQPDAGVLAQMLGIIQDENGFFPDVRYRLRPEHCVDRGIYVCGAAHSPANWSETEYQAINAAFRTLRHIKSGQVTSEAPFAVVDEKLCTGCGSCVEACPFHAISMNKREGILDLSRIDPMLCKGCGNCIVSCPVKAISMPLDDDSQIIAQIDAVLADSLLRDDPQNGKLNILAFGCEWSGYAAAELAGAKRLSYPVEIQLLEVKCSARVDPLHILWAFSQGADGVFLGACSPGKCHYIDGNKYAQKRISTLCDLMKKSGFDPRRLRLEWITPDDPEDFVNKITNFTTLIRALGQSPVHN
ncbi:MAG: hydrogenase iron-sulfur subunit, partial [Anaerolineales bacterium]|nr:hydrogenase iron-sulfur subunit [Anaerolineales bacterium]